MRLAYAELYLTLGYMFRRLGPRSELHYTEYERDVAFVQEYFISAPGRQSGCITERFWNRKLENTVAQC